MNRKTYFLLSALSFAMFTSEDALVGQNLNNLTAAAMSIPNQGVLITPLAPKGAQFVTLNPGLSDFPNYVAGQAVTSVVSPTQNTLLVLCSGYNQIADSSGNTIAADSTQFVFVFDISRRYPVQTQVIPVPNTYNGIVFDPSGTTFYVSGGVDDDVHIFDLGASGWAERSGSPIALGHNNTGLGLAVQPQAAGIAITANGQQLVVANYYNDSISVLTKGANNNAWTKTGELDLRPGKIDPTQSGKPGGEYPFWVAIQGNNTAYVSSLRDREVDVITLGANPTLQTRIPVPGQPNKMVLNGAGTTLYVAQDESDSVAVINTANNTVQSEIYVGGAPTFGSASPLPGNNTNSVTLSRDENSLYVTNGTANDVAVFSLPSGYMRGLIPTGLYPNSVSFSADGIYMYVVNGKSPTGPNPGYCHGQGQNGKTTAQCYASNQYDLQLIKAGMQTFPAPSQFDLINLTSQVTANNNYSRLYTGTDTATMDALRQKIQHVIYVIKENRTYDQILGDLPVGNGDPSLTEFGQAITPNLHNLAQNFVTLDNFYDRSEVSMDGWPWSVSARAPDVVERQTTVNYAGRGLSNDSEGTNRNVNVSLSSLSARLAADPLSPNDPDVLPGTTDTSAPDGPNDQVNTGYLWDQAKRAGISIRNYGFFIDLVRYQTLPSPYTSLMIPLLTDPFSSSTQVAYPTNDTLAPVTDIYYRGFDNSFPDYYRYTEFARDFDANYANGGLPALTFVRLMHDHTGNFSTALNNINTPELQQADNDYAVGLLVQKIAQSQYASNTLIFVIEDDSQDGGDHVDAHRSIAFIVGPYVKQHAVVSTSYNTLDFVRTIESILGLSPLNISDALATPMADVFDLSQTTWNYTATASTMLVGTGLPLPSSVANLKPLTPTHSSAYWAAATQGMDFSAEDRIDFAKYNRILWKGLMGDRPYPAAPTGKDLRKNRKSLLARYYQRQAGCVPGMRTAYVCQNGSNGSKEASGTGESGPVR